jgi:IMP dehydrogenase
VVKVAQGVSGSVVDKGTLRHYLPYLMQGVRLGFQDMGAKSIDVLKQRSTDGSLKFQLRSPAAQGEGNVHSVHAYEKR